MDAEIHDGLEAIVSLFVKEIVKDAVVRCGLILDPRAVRFLNSDTRHPEIFPPSRRGGSKV